MDSYANIADRMKDLLSEEERFLLIASAWLHDIGMNPDLYRDNSNLNIRGKEKLAKWNKSVRDTHAERSVRYVDLNKDSLKLTDDEYDNIKKMCLLHRQKTYKDKELEQQLWEWKNNDKVKKDILEIIIHKYNMDETSLDEELKNCDGEIRKEFDEEMERKKKKLNLYYVTDSCVSNLFSRQIAKKVLFGANGIGNSGMVSHTLGHLAIADMAKLNNIPVYVLAETMKVGDLQVRRDLQRSNQWLTTDIKFDYLISDLINYNPREDIITPDKITAFITEKGSIQPATEIWRYKDDECYALS